MNIYIFTIKNHIGIETSRIYAKVMWIIMQHTQDITISENNTNQLWKENKSEKEKRKWYINNVSNEKITQNVQMAPDRVTTQKWKK